MTFSRPTTFHHVWVSYEPNNGQSYCTLVHRHSFTPEWLPMSLYPVKRGRGGWFSRHVKHRNTNGAFTESCSTLTRSRSNIWLDKAGGCFWAVERTFQHQDGAFQSLSEPRVPPSSLSSTVPYLLLWGVCQTGNFHLLSRPDAGTRPRLLEGERRRLRFWSPDI